jgi:hypothetical protein
MIDSININSIHSPKKDGTNSKMSKRGPSPNSNYVLDDQLLVGWYPTVELDQILTTDRDVFVSLVTINERTQLGFYESLVIKKSQKPVSFIHYPIEDLGIPSDPHSFRKFIQHLAFLKNAGHKMYIHCRGGHGRTGTVLGCLLKTLGHENVLEIVQSAHATRENLPHYPSPEKPEQVAYVTAYDV